MPNFSRPTNRRLDVTFTVRPFCLWGNNSRLSFGRTLGGFQSRSTCGDSKFLALQCVVSLLLLFSSSFTFFFFFLILLYLSDILLFLYLCHVRLLPLHFYILPSIIIYACHIFIIHFLVPPHSFFLSFISFTIYLFLHLF